MRKLLFIAAVIAAIAPGLLAGVDTEKSRIQDQRAAMLRERFFSWCNVNGYRLDTMSENASETLWIDVWAETEDYQNAADSVDSVIKAQQINNILN